MQTKIYLKFFKRPLDIVFAIFILIITIPIHLVVILLLFFNNRGKVFFIQTRPGKDEKLFKIIKYKTMNDRKNSEGMLLPDNIRLTWLGKLIRKTSIDELPQLVNVIQGDLSLIGPRPLLVDYLSLYNSFQKRRHEVTPGITGWAQVNGRNAISWEEKFKLDVWYVQNVSFKLDLKILYLTILKVLTSNNVNSSENITMRKFTGNSQ